MRHHRRQHQHRQCPVKAGIGKAQRGAVALLEVDAGVAIFGFCRSQVDLGLVDRGQVPELGRLGERKSEAAGAAADLEQILAIADAGMFDEQRR